MRIFMDWEFSRLSRLAAPISLALVPDVGEMLYAVFDPLPKDQSDFVKHIVIPRLPVDWSFIPGLPRPKIVQGRFMDIAIAVKKYFTEQELTRFEIWTDVQPYDWMWFCDLFDTAENIPSNVSYICYDLATALKVKGLNPDGNREKLSDFIPGPEHNALHDAMVLRNIVNKVFPETYDGIMEKLNEGRGDSTTNQGHN